MADLMEGPGKLDEKPIVLLNEKATRAAIENVFCRQLAEDTKPGDEIFIYWSGHGGRCSSRDPDKKNGMDEYPVPDDGKFDDTNTMLLADTFGVWMLKLSGRRIAVILDACYAAGNSNHAKALPKAMIESRSLAVKVPFDFFNMRRTKALGQTDLAMLASSTADQMSFECRDGDLSAMTYFLVHRLREATGPVSLDEASQAVKQDVPKYVEENFPGSTQTPVFVTEMPKPIYLRP